MTPSEQQAALREITQITGHQARVSLETEETYIPMRGEPMPHFWRCSFIFAGHFFQSDATTSGEAVQVALYHVRKETAKP